jgi:hypothetical protein
MFLFAGMIVTSALIIWKGLIVVTGSESPVVVVLSGSMEPGFKRVCTSLHNEKMALALDAVCFYDYFVLDVCTSNFL